MKAAMSEKEQPMSETYIPKGNYTKEIAEVTPSYKVIQDGNLIRIIRQCNLSVEVFDFTKEQAGQIHNVIGEFLNK